MAMPINPDAVGSTSDPIERSWHSKDALLYAVGVGAGAIDPLAPGELPFTTENSRPKDCESAGRKTRTAESVGPPGGNGISRRTGLLGYRVCA